MGAVAALEPDDIPGSRMGDGGGGVGAGGVGASCGVCAGACGSGSSSDDEDDNEEDDEEDEPSSRCGVCSPSGSSPVACLCVAVAVGVWQVAGHQEAGRQFA